LTERSKTYPEITRQRLQAAKALTNLAWVEEQIRNRLQQLDLGEIPALKLYADIQWKKIDKCLPDLKQVEHTGQVATEVTVRFNP
jgi:hypothetical protein